MYLEKVGVGGVGEEGGVRGEVVALELLHQVRHLRRWRIWTSREPLSGEDPAEEQQPSPNGRGRRASPEEQGGRDDFTISRNV
ncbi:hypothetical protein PR202_gb18143 [Eleusine coracana subsp. coracana]|uniref:Uncharacterized protein n=1 Tax=Eleusine coracana subsp. coracana TaxID=191504 RepID=A0AAV5F6K9_ELECO|nr:hypothetical protein PR202_gb18143 [Eleusine coracana subsp. coracana]